MRSATHWSGRGAERRLAAGERHRSTQEMGTQVCGYCRERSANDRAGESINPHRYHAVDNNVCQVAVRDGDAWKLCSCGHYGPPSTDTPTGEK